MPKQPPPLSPCEMCGTPTHTGIPVPAPFGLTVLMPCCQTCFDNIKAAFDAEYFDTIAHSDDSIAKLRASIEAGRWAYAPEDLN